ncbi:uncharacterized protein LOC129298726 [Prosopis cineraria]|uniref:uncharacterized protein LOC129298726 n=1 Tax=Prosopis cineraria TaxID=364024 RepID=UPI00240F8169|nr:uncharacterized protein LOC129298726 [Prosopis cineraria]
MDGARFKSMAFFIVVVVLLLSVSEGRPLMMKPEEEVVGIFRTLKGSGPSPGPGHRVTKVQNLMGTENSGPSRGEGHWLERGQEIGVVKHSGPSPGQGHKAVASAENRS